jgi:hypothetical protein
MDLVPSINCSWKHQYYNEFYVCPTCERVSTFLNPRLQYDQLLEDILPRHLFEGTGKLNKILKESVGYKQQKTQV